MSTLLEAGVQLMLVGMGTVFFFLTILVFATTAMSKLVGQFFPHVEQDAANHADADHAEEVAAITAAIRLYRNNSQP